MSKLKKNFIYNIIYQVLILLIPLITSPYLSRVVGVHGIGIYSYTYSIVYYFMLFCLLGLNNYGNRTIAKIRNNKEELSKTFMSIYIFQLFIGIIMLITYLIFTYFIFNKYRDISLIQSMFLISAVLDINWFFFGIEKFKLTISRNIFLKLLSLLFIFLFVKQPNDVWKYTIIMAGTTMLSQILMWFFLKKYICFKKVSLIDVFKHIKPNLILFIPVVAVSLYKIMDKIMLGLISNVNEVGYYENAEKIINIPLAIISALGIVMLPRISNILASGEKKLMIKYINNSIIFTIFLSLAMTFGLAAVGYNFAPLFFGKDFLKTGVLIVLLSITIPFIAFANVIRTQYLIPSEKDIIYIKSVFLGALLNLLLNLIFIPIFNSVGACIGTIAAEIGVMFYQSFAIRKELPIKEYLIRTIPFLIKSIIMFVIIYLFNYINMNNLIRLCIPISLGCLIYGLLNIKYITSIINIKKIFHRKKEIK